MVPSSVPVARQLSNRLVMDAVLRHGPISRAEIARRTGLSKQTISDVMRELEAEGWVGERGQVQGLVGRSATTYEVRGGAAYVIGIDLGGTKLHLALADLTGTVVAETMQPTDRRGGIHVVGQIVAMAEAVVGEVCVDRAKVRAGAMGSPGVVDRRSGGIAIAPNIPGLDAIDMPRALKAGLGFDVLIENDVNLAASGERWRGQAGGMDDFAFIAAGTGIGMGLICDGRLVRGSRGAAGEIAYLPVAGDPYDARSLRYGTLETAIGSAAITDRYAALSGRPGLSVRAIFDALKTDPVARATLDEIGRAVATAIAAVHSVVDPELVVLGGSIGVRPEFKAAVERHLARCMTTPVPLAISSLGSRATLIGAIGSALAALQHALFGIGAGADFIATPVPAETGRGVAA